MDDVILRFAFVMLWLALGCVAFGAPETTVVDPEKLLSDGEALQRQATAANSVQMAAGHLEKAINLCRQLTNNKPDFFRGHAMWAHCLFQELKLGVARTPAERDALAQATRERFAIAARCPDPEWTLYEEWGAFLVYEAGAMTGDAAQRAAVLREAEQAFASGLDKTRFSKQRAELERALGMCLLLEARLTTDDAERVKIFSRVDERFAAAAKTKADARMLSDWGMTLMELGKLKGDPAILQRAVDRLRQTVEMDSYNNDARYNLVCCLALLDQQDEALAELKTCLGNDWPRKCFKMARDDADLKALRELPAFDTLLKSTPAPGEPEKLLAAGMESQKSADSTNTPSVTVALYEKAIASYTKAAEARPDFYAAHALWAHCLFKLVITENDPTRRAKLFAAARERVGMAAKCPDAEWHLQQEWGVFVGSEADKLPDTSPQHRALLVESRQAFEKALELAQFNRDRAQLQRNLGTCLARLAHAAHDPEERRQLYAQAVAQFEAGTQFEEGNAGLYAVWGMALMEIGKSKNDRDVLRKAIERLRFAADKDLRNSDTQYNLACCFALLNQPEAALRHLGACFGAEGGWRFRESAPKDADLKSLRNIAEFRTLIAE